MKPTPEIGFGRRGEEEHNEFKLNLEKKNEVSNSSWKKKCFQLFRENKNAMYNNLKKKAEI